ncbi:Uma2 family endonuclease [Streptomyces sp. NPDC002589]|uniref:Uma2 family endonuclease n=1 Tax=Streptomyces sp. NPDC002589 TaxID=3154420 RepID=UPI00332E5D94
MTLMAERLVIDDAEPRGSFEELLDLLDELNVPDGYKAEIIRGSIVVSPWSKAYYADVMDMVCDQLRPHLPEEHRISWGPLLYVFPGVERAYGPDIHAAHRSARRSTSNRLDGQALSFVAELTSPATRDEDRTDKLDAYSKVGVPIYLLLDMQEEQATVFWEPTPNGYQGRLTKSFSEKLYIPDPIGCTLDTDGFQAPQDDEG